MRVAVVGVGAVGGTIAAGLGEAGAEVSVLARGATLEAVRRSGVTVHAKTGRRHVDPVAASDDAGALGLQDMVVLGLKGQVIPRIAPQLAPLLGPGTIVVTAVNGIPWWYTYGLEGGLDGPLRDRPLESVDPEGTAARSLGPERAIGCVVYVGSAIREPGVIEHQTHNAFILGEPVGGLTARLERTAALFREAGFKVEATASIRTAVWDKMMGNAAVNPLSALTGASMGQMGHDPGMAAIMTAMMGEVRAVATALGAAPGTTIEDRLEVAKRLGPFRTSMLQDMDRGSEIELDPILGALIELGRLADVPTPGSEAIYALLRQRATLAGCYRPPGGLE